MHMMEIYMCERMCVYVCTSVQANAHTKDTHQTLISSGKKQNQPSVLVPSSVSLLFLFSETGLLYVALGVLKLTLALNSQRPICLCWDYKYMPPQSGP